jgi:N-formylglutamate deformylase
MDTPFRFSPGTTPLLVSVPHASRRLPASLPPRMTEAGLQVLDTDWHVDALFSFAPEAGASFIAAGWSRYVVDLNRDPSGRPLYAGADNTEICPTTTFAREPIYLPGQEPDAAEIAGRVDAYWRPYHDKVAAELERLRDAFGHAILLDCHSIRSRLPRFFEGRLPNLNLGTADGASAAPGLRVAAHAALGRDARFTSVLDGRFKGGHITRRHGDPARGIHSLQIEITWDSYMDEDSPDRLDAARAEPLVRAMGDLVGALLEWRPAASMDAAASAGGR